MSKASFVLSLFVLAAGAAQLSPAFAADAGHRDNSALARAASSADLEQPARDPSALTVLAEIALERGDCKAASENYAEALPAGNANLAQRASAVALACEHLPAAWEAAQRWRKLAPGDTDAAAVYATIAVKLYRISDAQAAVRSIILAADGEPRLAELTSLLLDESEPPAVLKTISGAVDESTASPPVLTLLAELALNGFDFSRAERYAQKALAKDPRLFEARSLLGQIYAHQGDATKALEAAHSAAEADPKRGTFEVAQALILLNRIPDARKELLRVRGQNEGFAPEIDRRLALLALQENDIPEARRLLESLATQPNGNETATFYLAEIDALTGDNDKALAGYLGLVNSSLAVTARTRAAGLLLDRGKRGDALKLLDAYSIDHPESAFEMTMTKARLLGDHGEADSGLALIAAALEQHPMHPTLEYDRAVLLESDGKERESVGVLEKLLEERPEDPTIMNALGYTLADHGMRLPKAEGLIRRALADTPDNAAVIDSLGWVRYKRGDARGASKLLARAYALSHDSEIAAHWGEAVWKAGDKVEARKIWSDALALEPTSKALQAVTARFVPPPSKKS